jgi:hypothetical protein
MRSPKRKIFIALSRDEGPRFKALSAKSSGVKTAFRANHDVSASCRPLRLLRVRPLDAGDTSKHDITITANLWTNQETH